MPLAPIRGAPPDAPIPDFPGDVPKANSLHPTAAAAAKPHQPEASPPRQRHAPVDIRCDGAIVTFKVIPELPAISRSRLIISVSADTAEGSPPRMLASFELSPVEAERFLTELRHERFPIVIGDDALGSMKIECELTDSTKMFAVQDADSGTELRRFPVDRTFDLSAMADNLLADLGT